MGARGGLCTYNNVHPITNARTPSNFTHRQWRPRMMYILNNRINHETSDVRLFLTRSARVVPNYSTRFATADDVASQCTQCLLFILSRASVLYHLQTLLVPCVISIPFLWLNLQTKRATHSSSSSLLSGHLRRRYSEEHRSYAFGE